MRNDHAYYYQRAEKELLMAQKAESPESVKAHYTLAGYYLDMVYRPTCEEAPVRNTEQSASYIMTLL